MSLLFGSSSHVVHADFGDSLPLPGMEGLVPARAAGGCDGCRMASHCLPQGLATHELGELQALVAGRRRLRRGESLILPGRRLGALYAVRFGSFKSALSLSDGTEHVTGFALAGDVLGFDALATGVHETGAVALEDAEVCVLPYEALQSMPAASHAGACRRLGQMLAAEMSREHWLLALQAHTNAEPRVAAFLLQLSHRMRERGYSGTEFNLRMSRAEIGSYLGLRLESVSRVLSSLAARGLVAVRKKKLHLLDPAALAASADAALPGVIRGFAQWQGTAAAKRAPLMAPVVPIVIPRGMQMQSVPPRSEGRACA